MRRLGNDVTFKKVGRGDYFVFQAESGRCLGSAIRTPTGYWRSVSLGGVDITARSSTRGEAADALLTHYVRKYG